MRSLLLLLAMTLQMGSTALAQTPAVSALSPVNGPVTIIYKFVPGEDLKYAMSSTTSGMMDINGQSMPMTQTMSSEYHQIVQSVDSSGNATISISMQNMKMTMQMGGRTMPIPTDAAQKAVQGMTMVMSPHGKMISVSMGSGASSGGMNMSKMFTPGTMGNMAMLPDHPVNIGDTWRGTMQMAGLGLTTYLKMTLNGISTLTGSTIAKIGLKTYATFNPSDLAPGMPAMTGQVNGTGTMDFDLDDGYPKSSAQNMVMTMNIAAPQANAGGNTPPVAGTMTMNISGTMNLISVTQGAPSLAPTATPTPTPTPAAPTQP